MASYAHTHEISGPRQNNLPMCPMKDVRYWLHMSTLTTDGNYIKVFAGPFRETETRRKNRRLKKQKQQESQL